VQRRLTYINETEELLMKKLYKSNNRMICGVCAGLAEYLGIDPTVVRLIWAALGLTGTGILLYIIAALVMPENMDIL
jgi:phage shock protein C